MLAAEAPMIDKEVVVGQGDVLQVFELKGKQPSAVAGCRVTDGNVQQALQWRVMRGGEPVYDGKCGCIKRHKLEVERVGKGTECGVTLQGFADFLDLCCGIVVSTFCLALSSLHSLKWLAILCSLLSMRVSLSHLLSCGEHTHIYCAALGTQLDLH